MNIPTGYVSNVFCVLKIRNMGLCEPDKFLVFEPYTSENFVQI
jgi:hypothetical protein